jgi:membrane protein
VIREIFSKFFADRGTHLAAMIAYFALLSFVPLLFLTFALLGLFGRANESSYLVTELQKIFPGASISSIVSVIRTIQSNATSLGLLGAGFLLWSSLSLFSVLESAFNIVYERPNRPFLRGKALAVVFMLGSLVTLFAGLLAGGIGAHLLNRFAPGFLGNAAVATVVSVLVSTIAIFLFLVSSYQYLTNAALTVREVLPGACVATVALEATFQVLPFYLRLSKHVPAAQAFGGPVLLLIWLYVMANVIVFGAEVNWWLSRASRPGAPRPPGHDASSGASTRSRARPPSASRPRE